MDVLEVAVLLMNVFNMITEIRESKTMTKHILEQLTTKCSHNIAKTMTKHISCECKCKFDGRK